MHVSEHSAEYVKKAHKWKFSSNFLFYELGCVVGEMRHISCVLSSFVLHHRHIGIGGEFKHIVMVERIPYI